ncbi:hypothetical protein MGYG_05867 [Nannizzia gypsea CBS 118893]|uniref:Transcriptional regulator n=1 Tax=Arthroderma gypseum (strain ATCC MYA-4604 / CBS 118893) TaxID=535722 RepID=E4UZS9_ARTGP|nr:hypothetical protein MGYG_05867 [Nannizzia gypsea CBS 118893]EFR02866.1 hypothetical protein MGYG_05867 [Nannizzia gypsea CBS 118893]
MSDSESETRSTSGFRSAKDIEQGLRDTVANIYRSGNLDELTVKRVRLATEQSLGLEQGFLKAHEEWKRKSDEIIKDEVEIQENPPPKPAAAPKKPQLKKRASPKTQKASTPAKKRKKAPTVPSEEENDSISSEMDSDPEPVSKKKSKAPPVKGSRSKKAAKAITDSEEDNSVHSVDDNDGTSEPGAATKAAKVADAEGASESEMSVLIDEEPKPKPKRKKPAGPTVAQGKGKKLTSEKKRKEAVPEDPDQAEIKRLQGWLVKCGIRKVWGRELMGCSTPKEKIRHLKSMLKDAGMDGRYSIEKANRIREDRELKADLEAAQEGAKIWGANVDEEGESSKAGRSSRRIAKSFKQLDFLGQDDQDSESD